MSPFPARLTVKGPIYAFGDVHGDIDAARLILRHWKLIDKHDHWTGGDATAIQNGDSIGRGRFSRATTEFFMRLQTEARGDGGYFLVLLGNHEILPTQGDLKAISREDDFLPAAASGLSNAEWFDRARALFVGDSPLTRWLAARPAVVVVNQILFVHAGIEDWLEHVDLDEVNRIVGAWMRFYQGRDKPPPGQTAWVMGRQGPMWSRALVEGKIKIVDLDRMLKAQGIRRIVVGHTKIKPRQILTPHPLYGQRLWMIDTGISSQRRETLSSLVIKPNGQITPRLIKACRGDLTKSR